MYTTRLPEVVVQASLAMQKAVEQTGQEVEFLAQQAVAGRRRSGREQASMRWRPARNRPFYGEVVAGTFYTRFSEYGTVHQSAHPALGPAAETAYPHFVADIGRAYR